MGSFFVLSKFSSYLYLMKYFIFVLLVFVMYSCKPKQVFYTDYILVERIFDQQDTIKNSYWNKFYMDDYKMEWLLKTNNINPKDVIDIRLLYTTKIKFTKKQLIK
jgi:hypothetical protein